MKTLNSIILSLTAMASGFGLADELVTRHCKAAEAYAPEFRAMVAADPVMMKDMGLTSPAAVAEAVIDCGRAFREYAIDTKSLPTTAADAVKPTGTLNYPLCAGSRCFGLGEFLAENDKLVMMSFGAGRYLAQVELARETLGRDVRIVTFPEKSLTLAYDEAKGELHNIPNAGVLPAGANKKDFMGVVETATLRRFITDLGAARSQKAPVDLEDGDVDSDDYSDGPDEDHQGAVKESKEMPVKAAAARPPVGENGTRMILIDPATAARSEPASTNVAASDDVAEKAPPKSHAKLWLPLVGLAGVVLGVHRRRKK